MKRSTFHCIAAVLLAVASLAIWRWQFVAVPGVLPEMRLEDPLVGWESRKSDQHEVIMDQGTPVLHLERKGPKEKLPSVNVWLGKLEGVKFVYISCEARWENVVVGPLGYHTALFAVTIRDENGKLRPLPDSDVFYGIGTSDWKRQESVVELTKEIVDTRLSIAMYGKSGVLEVRDLSVVAVKHRWWVRPAAVLVVAGWIALCAALLRGSRCRPAWWRCVLAGSVVVLVSWVVVFPQTKGQLRPIAGGFSVGEAEEQTIPEPDPPAPVPKPKPQENPIAPVVDVAPKPVPPPAPAPVSPLPKPPPASPEPEQRDTGVAREWVRSLDAYLRHGHLALFAGLTFVVLLIGGGGSLWRLPFAVAVLSELVPALCYRMGDREDWGDLLENLMGVGVGVLLWWLMRLIGERRRKRRAQRV